MCHPHLPFKARHVLGHFAGERSWGVMHSKANMRFLIEKISSVMLRGSLGRRRGGLFANCEGAKKG
jgi:hypothetical protein